MGRLLARWLTLSQKSRMTPLLSLRQATLCSASQRISDLELGGHARDFAVERPEVASSMSLKVVKAAHVHPLPSACPHPARPARPIEPMSGLTRPAVREHAPAPLPNYHHHLVPNDRLRTRGSLSQNPSFRVGRVGWRAGEGEGVSVCGSNCLLLRSRAARSPSALCGSVGRIGVPSCGVRSDAQ